MFHVFSIILVFMNPGNLVHILAVVYYATLLFMVILSAYSVADIIIMKEEKAFASIMKSILFPLLSFLFIIAWAFIYEATMADF